MKKALLKFFGIYVLFVAVFMLMKPVFMAAYFPVMEASPSEWLAVIRHGFSMDLCVAGYLTVVPGMLITASLITGRRWPRLSLEIYMGIAVAITAMIYCLDLGLYGTWGFRLDMTPVFYFTTSPSAAMASLRWYHWLGGILGIVAFYWGMWTLYRVTAGRMAVAPAQGKRRLWAPAVMMLATGLLFIPIRGSVTVSTMNLSRAYFSANQRLNHAAINPAFSLLYSATHQGAFDTQYDFMENDEASREVVRLLHGVGAHEGADSVARAGHSDGYP